jgi:hypothetical protein
MLIYGLLLIKAREAFEIEKYAKLNAEIAQSAKCLTTGNLII